MDKKQLNERYFKDPITRYGFISHMESYMKQLLTNPLTAHIDDYLKSYGLDDEKALSSLLKRTDKNDEESAVLLRTEKIKTGDDGKDMFVVTYKLPRKDYKKKMRDLFINLFESNIVEGCPINEDLNYFDALLLSSTPPPFSNSDEKVIAQGKPGDITERWANYVNDNENNYVPQVFGNQEQMIKDIESMDTDKKYKKCGGLDKKVNETDCAGCMQGGGNNPDAGQFVAPLTEKPITRTVLMNEEQFEYVKKMLAEDAPAVMNTPAGDFGFDAPGLETKGDDPSLDDQNILKDKNLSENKKKIGARRKQ